MTLTDRTQEETPNDYLSDSLPVCSDPPVRFPVLIGDKLMNLQAYTSQTLKAASRRQHQAYLSWSLMDGPLTVTRSMMKKGFSICSIRMVLFCFRLRKGI